MPLNPGTRLGPYEITGAIGAGGMGEVYRARDLKLDRDVAVKVLPAHLADDPDALARFEREAKAVAALSHPNILAIHDFGRDPSAGVTYAVMELLEGETLRARLAAGPLPSRKVVQIGIEIAHGLAAAHGGGIVHRDLKPENVFVTSDGRVKILDFGLARALAPAGDETSAPTARQTDPGTVLGTVGYMSPEQVKGRPADHRSDIFALGCVLFELATGRRAFHRETPAETMTAILRDDAPEMTGDGGSGISSAIEPVIRHCLEKQPEERFQSARDLAFALDALSASSAPGARAIASGAEPAIRPSEARRALFVPVAAAAALAAAAFFAGRALAPGARPSVSATLTFQQLTDDAGIESNPAISPNGESLAFVSSRRGSSDIYVQRIGGRNPVLVAGDPERQEGAPAFSPDGSSIAFHDARLTGGIFITGATGESTRRVTDFGADPAWSPDGQRLAFCTEAATVAQGRSSTSALWVVDVKGGEPIKLSDGDAMQPSWSPSGRHLAYWAVDTGQRDLYTMPADGGPRVAVTSDAATDWTPRWSPDGRYLYFASDRGGAMNLWRVPMDEASGAPAGPPEPVTVGVATAEQPSLSGDGRHIVFRWYEGTTNPAAIPFDPVSETVGPPRQILDRSESLWPTGVSPDGQWLLLNSLLERQEDIFIARTDGSDLRRLTDDLFRDRLGVYSPDLDAPEIAFFSNRKNAYHAFAVRPDGSGLRALTDGPADDTRNLMQPVYSPRGDRLIVSRGREPETVMIDPRRAWADQQPEVFDTRLPDGSWLVPAAWSPDGRRWAGYVTNSAGASVGLGIADVASRTVRQLTNEPVSAFSLVWLLDSRRVVYGSFLPTGNTDVVLFDVETGRRKTLATYSSYWLLPVVASPDRQTLYSTVTRAQADIWMATIGESR
ncbi:MAG TPA: protein kinase [Vicinamibacterales bacterium]|nr:protein kinase [Vicinamibacterales bacterium]